MCHFKPFLDDGVLRIGGRLSAAPIKYDAKHQIIVPRESQIVPLLIRWFHAQTGHSGREYVLAKIREKYWIIRPQYKIRQILKACVVCKKNFGVASVQQMSELPENRLKPDKPPFSYVGVDCFGNFLVRVGRSKVKRYGVIFCCLVTRAIHIEIVYSMDTNSFIMALQRFICRRGQVLEIRSDNGPNFVSGEKEIKQAILAWNQAQINDYLLQENIKWIFHTHGASHHGGIYERQIRTVKKILSCVCHQQVLSDECLSTLMCEYEYIVNGRPVL